MGFPSADTVSVRCIPKDQKYKKESYEVDKRPGLFVNAPITFSGLQIKSLSGFKKIKLTNDIK